MKLKKRSNGVWYLYRNRLDQKSLGTRDKDVARAILQEEKAKEKAAAAVRLEKVKNISLNAFMKEYLEARHQLVILGELSSDTHRNDSIALRRLLGVVGDIPLKNVEQRITRFKTALLAGAPDMEKRKATINTYIRHLASAFSWAATPDTETGRPAYLAMNPFAETRTRQVKFRGIKRLPKFLAVEEIGQMKKQLAAEISDLKTRIPFSEGIERHNMRKSLHSRLTFAPMLDFYLYAGVRVGELVGLSWANVRLQDGIIRINPGKTREERVVPVPPALKDVIMAMGPKDVGRVFNITGGHASRMFKRLARAAGLDESKTLKGLRHSYGTLAAAKGMDLDVISKNMGHSSVKTTEIYKEVLAQRQVDQSALMDFRDQLTA